MNVRAYDEYVFAVEKHGSLTRAAAALGISQPALSAGLSNLEKALGFRLFFRNTQPVTVTEEGAIYIDYIRRLKVLAEDFERRLADYRKASGSTVTIGGATAYLESTVTKIAAAFSEKYPDYNVELRSAQLDTLIELTEKGKIDFFISTSENLPGVFRKELIKKEILYLCIPKKNPLNAAVGPLSTEPGSAGSCFDYGILSGQKFIFLEETQPLQIQLRTFAGLNGIELKSTFRVDQVSTAVRLAAEGQGICLASEDALSGKDHSGLCIYALPAEFSVRNIYLAYDPELISSEACRAFLEFAEATRFR